MLVIRMQRVGRKGHPEFRVVVQDSRTSPTSERVVARIGHYNPHTKAVTLEKEKVEHYLKNGAQPSPRVVSLLKSQKVKLPEWVTVSEEGKKRAIKNLEKLRRNRPTEPKTEEVSEESAEIEVEAADAPVEAEVQVEEKTPETVVEEVAENPAE